LTARKTRAFDPKRHLLHEGIAYERTREPEIDGGYLRIVYVQIGRLVARRVNTGKAWEQNVYEQVIVED
jgi:hypothetical protein